MRLLNRFYSVMKATFLILLSLALISISPFLCFADEPSSIQVNVAVLKNFPPQYSISPSGKPMGFAIDIIEAIAELANLQIKYKIQDTWAEMFEALESGSVDLIPNQGITERRKESFAFSHPVETFPVSIFTRTNENEITGLESLSGRKVAVVKLNVGEVLAKKEPLIRIQPYDHIEEALFNLLSGNVDALIFPEPVLWKLAIAAGIDDEIKVAGTPLLEVLRSISVARNNKALLTRINVAVDKLVGSDAYRRIYTRWYGKPAPFWTVEKAAGVLTALLILVVVLMGIWRYRSIMYLNRKLTKNLNKLNVVKEQLRTANDNLEQKVEERTARLNEAIHELETLFNNSQVGIMVLMGGRVLHKGNQRLADILGYETPLEMQGFSMKRLHLNEERFREFGEKYFDDLTNKEMIQVEYQLRHKNGTPVWCTLSAKALDKKTPADLTKGVVWVIDDISNKKQYEIERERLISDLRKALSEVKQLSGLLPICSHCKKIRDDKGYWNSIESYIRDHSEAEFSHSICQECAEKYYSNMDLYGDDQDQE